MKFLYLSQRLLKEFALLSNLPVMDAEYESLFYALKHESRTLRLRITAPSLVISSGTDGMKYYLRQWENIKEITCDDSLRLVCLFSLTWVLMEKHKMKKDFATMSLMATCFIECCVDIKPDTISINCSSALLDLGFIAIIGYGVWFLFFQK